MNFREKVEYYLGLNEGDIKQKNKTKKNDWENSQNKYNGDTGELLSQKERNSPEHNQVTRKEVGRKDRFVRDLEAKIRIPKMEDRNRDRLDKIFSKSAGGRLMAEIRQQNADEFRIKNNEEKRK